MGEMKFDLIDILKELGRRRKFILLLTFCAVVLGAIFCFLQKKQYTSESVVIVKSPQIMDRNRMYHETNYDPTIFFATNDDVDHIVTIAKSDGLARHIVNKFGLKEDYGYKSVDDAVAKFRKKFTLTRGDTKNLNLKFTHTDPDKTFEITREITDYIENVYRDYFFTINSDMVGLLEAKVKKINDTLTILDDSISAIRKTYGIYDAMAPARSKNVIQNASGLSSGNADAMEKLQQATRLKDQYLESMTEFSALIQEYKTNVEDKNTKLLYRVQDAYIPDTASFPKIPLILLICLVGGLLFASVLVVIMGFYNKISAKA